MDNIKSYLGSIQNYFKDLDSSQIILLYEGEISHEIVLTFTTIIERKLSLKNEKNRIQKKIYNVVVEVLQNIFNHGNYIKDKDQFKPGYGCFLIWSDDLDYHIVAGNVIKSDQVERLKNIIDNINQYNISELRDKYKVQLSEGRFSEKGGAGLGFIDMSRKSGNKIGYEFIKIDNNLSFFVNSYKVSK